MSTDILNSWIAQAKSWQSFKEFELPIEDIARYHFLHRKDDFYLSLLNQMMVTLDSDNLLDKNNELLNIAKGLEIYSLSETCDNFHGVDSKINLLYVSALYYLSGYTSSAFILANLCELKDYKSFYEKFLSQFLRRDLAEENRYSAQLQNYLQTGEESFLKKLTDEIDKDLEVAFYDNPDEYITLRIIEILIHDFVNNNIWSDLKKSLDSSIDNYTDYIRLGLTKRPQVWNFFPSQRKALEKGILRSTKTFSLQMPTSAGKTAICELIIYNHIINNSDTKVLYLAPFRALASELKYGLGRRLEKLGIKTKAIYGGNIPTQKEGVSIQDADVLISTPEKFLAIESLFPNIYNKFSLIICDEGHILDEGNRGVNYELLLSKFRATTSDEISRRFIFLSAIIPNIESVNEWLGGDDETVIKSGFRPTELDYGFLEEMKNGDYMLDINRQFKKPYNFQLYKFLTKSDFLFFNPTTKRLNTYSHKSFKSKSVAITLKAQINGTVALFTPAKSGNNGVEGLAYEMIHQLKDLKLPTPLTYAKQEEISVLKEHFIKIFGPNHVLTEAVEFGFLIHHGDIPQDVREIIEQAIRNSYIRIIICNNTLAEGVNLPIKTIVINSTRRFNGDKLEHIKIRDMKNLVGRAGRAGQETKGLIITTNPSDNAMIMNVINDKEAEGASGSLYPIIREITELIMQDRIVLDNETLENQSEEFLELLDSIDSSIINLLSEEIEVIELRTMIDMYVEKSYAFFQASETERDKLKYLYGLRVDRLTPYVFNKELGFIKSNNLNIRVYEIFKERVNLDRDFWFDVGSEHYKEFFDFIFDIIFSLPQVVHKLEVFNKNSKLQITINDIKLFAELWINGNWYPEISDKINLPVDALLKVHRQIISSLIEPYVSKIVNIALSLSQQREETISELIINWPNYLRFGLNSKLQLSLIELDFEDRDSIICLSEYLENHGCSEFNLRSLKAYIKASHKDILSEIERDLTKLSLSKLISRISAL